MSVLDWAELRQVLTLGKNGERAFEEVFMFSHRDGWTSATFITLTTASGASISATPGHYLWAAGAPDGSHLMHGLWTLARAADVHVGDCLMSECEGGCSRVVRRALTVQQGLFNPHTKSGSIVVDGLAATTFTDILTASLSAHAAVTAPFRWLFQACKALDCIPAFQALNFSVLSTFALAPRVHAAFGKLWVQLFRFSPAKCNP